MPDYQYTAVFEPAEEGGYVVTMPALPGLVTEGDTLEEARAMVKDAIRGYLKSLIKQGEEIPHEPSPPQSNSLKSKSDISCPARPSVSRWKSSGLFGVQIFFSTTPPAHIDSFVTLPAPALLLSPFTAKTLKRGTLKRILDQTALSTEEFI
jgi:antitoxin HicB